MKSTFLRILAIVPVFLTTAATLSFAQADPMVMYRTNTTLLEQNGNWAPLTGDLAMPGGINVFTNGTFQIKEGIVRDLEEGQRLRADGFLLNPDGSTLPVFDHLSMKGGVTIFRDGEGAPLEGNYTLPDGSIVEPDGWCTRPNGRRSRLQDGQLLTLEGIQIGGLDTINMQNGRVTVFKAGALITLQPSDLVILGMYDGTRVNGLGEVSWTDGNKHQLSERETFPVAGVRGNW